VKKSLNDELCKEITSVLIRDGNKVLASLPGVFPLDPWADIDFTVLEPPTFTRLYLMTQHRGAFVPRNSSSSVPPFSATPLPIPSGNTTYMFALYMGSYMMDTVSSAVCVVICTPPKHLCLRPWQGSICILLCTCMILIAS